ncbi:Map microtubule affinity-regulating kinase [Tulasnella sp. JGI-2019a]|nr:Map microtubule affinity-regulating kinase [Tulasnella sp. JGI-2019a]
MSFMSKYSHEIIQQLINEETVILSAYVSETICTMYLFYKTSDPIPRCTPLSSLSRMTLREYHSLRLQVVEGVAFLHAARIVHRDLKTANIVVDLKLGLSMARIYIIDFGIARRCAPGYRCEEFRGTTGWTAPEVQDGARWEPISGRWLGRFFLAGTSDRVMSDILACHKPPLRPTAAALLDSLQISRPRPAKRPHSASAELPQAKFQAVMKGDDDMELEDE